MSKPRARLVADQEITKLVEQQSHLHDCVEELKTHVGSMKADLEKNTQVTEQVRDILGTFKVTMAIGKYVGIAAGAVAGVVAVVKGWKS